MYNEQVLVDRIVEQTGYQVELAVGSTIDMTRVQSLPLVSVGHAEIKVENPEDLIADSYRIQDNNLILLTEINVICDRNNLTETWTKIHNSYNEWTPYPEDVNYSVLIHIRTLFPGAVLNRTWFKQIVGFIFPRLS